MTVYLCRKTAVIGNRKKQPLSVPGILYGTANASAVNSKIGCLCPAYRLFKLIMRQSDHTETRAICVCVYINVYAYTLIFKRSEIQQSVGILSGKRQISLDPVDIYSKRAVDVLLDVACNEIETIKIQRLFIVYFQLVAECCGSDIAFRCKIIHSVAVSIPDILFSGMLIFRKQQIVTCIQQISRKILLYNHAFSGRKLLTL